MAERVARLSPLLVLACKRGRELNISLFYSAGNYIQGEGKNPVIG